MNITIQSVHFKASPHLEELVKEKVNRLAELSDKIISAHVTLTEEGGAQTCDIRLAVPGNDHFAKKSAATYEKSVTEAVNALEKIMQREKDKRISKRRVV